MRDVEVRQSIISAQEALYGAGPGKKEGTPVEKHLILARLRGRLGLFGGAGDFVLLLETVHAAGGIHQLLAAREERVAGGTDFDADVAFVRRFGLERVAAGADHVHRGISRMNSSFHFCGGDPFETLSITKTGNPRGPVRDPRGSIAIESLRLGCARGSRSTGT